MTKTKSVITTQIETINFGQVKIVRSEMEANDLLSRGWVLMNAGVSHTDMAGYQAKIHFILAKAK